MKQKQYKIIFGVVAALSLLFGFLIYVLFKEDTIISKLILQYVDVAILKNTFSFLDNSFLKYYFVDYLWALSLSSTLHLILMPNIKASLMCTGIVLILGMVFEILQYFGIINGTGDILDSILYLLAGITVNIINFKRGS